MQPEECDAAYLWDMLQACEEIAEMLEGHDLTAFLGNRMLQRAIERDVELVGEAARRLSQSFRDTHGETSWREIIGLRNILAHEYGRIDHELLYRTATEDIPVLSGQLRRFLAKEGGNP